MCRHLEPCGAGNPRPYLLVRDVRVYDIRQVGADSDHLRCKVTVGRFTFDAMAFRRGGHAADMTDAGRVDAVVSVGTGLRGFVELELRDFGPVGTAARMVAVSRGDRLSVTSRAIASILAGWYQSVRTVMPPGRTARRSTT